MSSPGSPRGRSSPRARVAASFSAIGTLPFRPALSRKPGMSSGRPLRWPSRVRAVRPPPRPLRVLHPRRGVQDPGARAKGGELEMPAVSLTDHGSMAGAIDLYKAASDQGIKPIFGCEVYVVDDRKAPDEGPRAPDPPRRRQHGLREPDQALLARLPGGLLLQAARRLGAARAPRAGDDRPLGLPLRPRLARARPRAETPTQRRSSTGSRRSSAATTRTSSCRTRGSRSSRRRSAGSPGSPSAAGCRSSRPATSTTSTPPTRTATTRSSASSRATR